MKTWAAIAAATFVGLSASPAAADLFVSGDSNIFNLSDLGAATANKTFLTNIAGGLNVVVRDSALPFLTTQASQVTNYLNGTGYSATLLGSGSAITAADLAGADLFIAFATTNAFSLSETAAISSFLQAGGNVLVTGENSDPVFANLNIYVNDLLASLGSGMRISPSTLGAGFHTASILTANAYTASTTGFQYAATSAVTGGTALYGTDDNRTAFLAYEATGGGVPEPATWAMMIAGFGLAGAALRRRSATQTA